MGLNAEHISKLKELFSMKTNEINGNSLNHFIDFFQKLKVERLLESVKEDERPGIQDAYKQAYEASREINASILAKQLPFTAVKIIMKHIQNLNDDPLCLKIFMDSLGLNYLANVKNKSELTDRLIELTHVYARIDEKKNNLMRVKDILLHCKNLSAHRDRFQYNIERLNNSLQYIEYLLESKIPNMTIYIDGWHIEDKINRVIDDILNCLDYCDDKDNLFPFLQEFRPSSLIRDKLTNLELCLLKERLVSAVQSYQANTGSVFNTLLNRRSQSEDRQKDITDFLQIIKQATTKEQLVTDIKSRFETVKKGILGHSDLVTRINSVLDEKQVFRQLKA
jgi:hypothetical protein